MKNLSKRQILVTDLPFMATCLVRCKQYCNLQPELYRPKYHRQLRTAEVRHFLQKHIFPYQLKFILYEIFFTILLLMALTGMPEANNIAVSNTKLTGQDKTNDYTLVQFDITWENSWRTSSESNNYYFAWLQCFNNGFQYSNIRG